MTKRLEITVVLARIGLRFLWSPIWRGVFSNDRRSRMWKSMHNRCVGIVLTGPWIGISFPLVFTAKSHAIFHISKRCTTIISSGLWLVIMHEFAGEGFLIVFAFDHSFIRSRLYVFVSQIRVVLPGSRILIWFEFILSAKLHSVCDLRSKRLSVINGSRANVGSLSDALFFSLLGERFLRIVRRLI